MKETFNVEEGLGQKRSVQSIMHRMTGYIGFRHTFILLETWNMAKFSKSKYLPKNDTLNLSI